MRFPISTVLCSFPLVLSSPCYLSDTGEIKALIGGATSSETPIIESRTNKLLPQDNIVSGVCNPHLPVSTPGAFWIQPTAGGQGNGPPSNWRKKL
jgi:hypothetical protein